MAKKIAYKVKYADMDLNYWEWYLFEKLRSVREKALEEAAQECEKPISPESKYHPGTCYQCDCHGECPQEYFPNKIRGMK